MNKVEALEWAADYADRNKIFEPVRNERGYADGWKIPTPAEKAKIISELAEQIVDPPSVEVSPFGAIALYIEEIVTELRKIRSYADIFNSDAAREIQNVSNRLEAFAKEFRGVSGSD